jgi:hypothetical protein
MVTRLDNADLEYLPDFVDAAVRRAVVGGAVMANSVSHCLDLEEEKEKESFSFIQEVTM